MSYIRFRRRIRSSNGTTKEGDARAVSAFASADPLADAAHVTPTTQRTRIAPDRRDARGRILASNHQFVYPIRDKSWRVADCLVKIDALNQTDQTVTTQKFGHTAEHDRHFWNQPSAELSKERR